MNALVAGRMHTSAAVETTLQRSETVSGASLREANRVFQPQSAEIPGSIFSFLPVHGDSRVGAVAEQLSRTLAEGLGVTTLLAGFDRRDYSGLRAAGLAVVDGHDLKPRHVGSVLDHARVHYHIVCADLSGAGDAHTLEALRTSDAIFLVSGSDPASITALRKKAEWLRSLDLIDRCALLLHRTDGGSARDVEDLTGLPMCSLVETAEQVGHLATWLAADTLARATARPETLALAG